MVDTLLSELHLEEEEKCKYYLMKKEWSMGKTFFGMRNSVGCRRYSPIGFPYLSITSNKLNSLLKHWFLASRLLQISDTTFHKPSFLWNSEINIIVAPCPSFLVLMVCCPLNSYFTSQPAFTCSKLPLETLKQGVKYVQR